ncbi:MAG: class I mannose-6-phosphate isomerase [Candidatus Acidiferrum sp.]|jgi:mannose-6-phosphate isomerase
MEPVFAERLWGSKSLAPLFPEMHDLAPTIGEAWLTSVACRIVTGPFAGQTLEQGWKEMTVGWRGEKFCDEADFPLLLKFIFPKDKLSIQVHPDDAYASRNEAAAGGRGKTEMWYVVSAEPGARLLAGLKPGVTKENFLEAMEGHTLEELFASYEVRTGDAFFLPAGMPHTIGAGMVIFEVQQYSDLTYRVYDYDRRDANGKPRPLHIEKALEVMNFKSNTLAKVTPHELHAGDHKIVEELVSCPYFSTWKWEFEKPAHMNDQSPKEEFSLWVFLEGEGTIGWSSPQQGMTGTTPGGEFSYRAGECWFIPAEFSSNGYYPKKKTILMQAIPRNPDVISEKNRYGQ